MHQPKIPVLDLIDPCMREVLEISHQHAGVPDHQPSLQRMRSDYVRERAYWNQGGPLMAHTIDSSVATRHGEVPVRILRPDDAPECSPAVVYLHGGGWVVGNLDTHDRIMRMLAAASGAVVVGVDYTLSPEARFPVAIEQSVDVARAVVTGLPGLPAAPRIAFAGDSAGASLSLASALLARDEQDSDRPALPLAGLLLYYGMFGLRDSASRRLMGGVWDGLDDQALAYYEAQYLRDASDAHSPHVDMLGADLSHGIPASHVVAAEFDPLLDDSAALASLMQAQGVAATHEVVPGVLHAFLHNSRHLPPATEAINRGAAFLHHVLFNDPEGV